MVKLHSNQKAIRIVKVKEEDSLFNMYNKAAAEKALLELSPNAFRLWFYLGGNADNYEFGLSQTEVQKKTRMAKNTYYRAVNELIDKGYLVEVELYPNLTGYLFIEGGPAE